MIWERTTGSFRISFIISLYQWSNATVANIHLWMPQTVILMSSCSKDSVHRANKCSSALCNHDLRNKHRKQTSLQIIPNPRSTRSMSGYQFRACFHGHSSGRATATLRRARRTCGVAKLVSHWWIMGWLGYVSDTGSIININRLWW